VTPIDPKLLKRLEKKLGFSKRRLYEIIADKVNATALPRHLAALQLAAEHGINISRFASDDDLAVLRQAAQPGLSSFQTVTPPDTAQSKKRTRKKSAKKGPASAKANRRRGNTVFVVHGRNERLTRALFSFLRAVRLNPMEWIEAIRLTGKPNPFIADTLDTAFREAAAVVVLLTPDDEARLKPEFVKPQDPEWEKQLTGQARPNVLFEAGMALGRNPDSTVLVQIGTVRKFSDISGMHVVHLSASPESRQEFITKLANAGCNVNTSGTHWLSEGDFSLPPNPGSASPSQRSPNRKGATSARGKAAPRRKTSQRSELPAERRIGYCPLCNGDLIRRGFSTVCSSCGFSVDAD